MSDTRTKKQILDDARALDERRQAQIARQIDSINRLLEAQEVGPVKRYEHELMTLNEQIALADIRRENMEGTLRKIRQRAADSLRMHSSSVLDSILEDIREVMPDEKSPRVAEGHTTAEISITEDEERPIDHPV